MGPNNASGIVWAIFIVITFPALQNIKKHLYMLVSKTNMKEKKKGGLTMGPNDTSCIVWAVFILVAFPAL